MKVTWLLDVEIAKNRDIPISNQHCSRQGIEGKAT